MSVFYCREGSDDTFTSDLESGEFPFMCSYHHCDYFEISSYQMNTNECDLLEWDNMDIESPEY